MKIAYIVSRFPHVSETFIVRELDAVEAVGGFEIELRSLFPARDEVVHPAAERWVGRLHRARPSRVFGAFGAWLWHRPLRLLSSLFIVALAYGRRPRLALRALVTCVIACQHALEMRSTQPDQIHAHYATYPALAAWLCSRLTGVGFSFTAHAHDLYVDRSMLVRKLADATLVVAISEFNREFLEAQGNPRGTPIHVVHCGVDPRIYAFRPRAPVAGRPVEALCIASLQEYKGHAVLLRALAMDGRLDRVNLRLVGSGPLLDELTALADELGIASRVSFEGGLTEDAVRGLLDRADLGVLPSIIAKSGQMEGIPVALMECLACGVPVVATRLSGIPELVADGITGLLATPGDPRELADAMARVVDDSDAALKRASNGRAKIESEFDVRASGARMAELFESQRDVPPARASTPDDD